jgi:hypothetical protein
MNYLDLYSSYPDRTIVAAWDCQVKEVETTPELADALMRRGRDLFPRFAVYYAELRALPRSARRALQRQLAQSRDLTATFPEWLQGAGWHSLQHKLARSLAGAAFLMALSQGLATAATINVTIKDPRVRPDGQCSLIEAIVNANADAAFFSDCPAGDGADTIVLPAKANVGVRDVYDNTYGPTGLPLITSSITIQGNGARIRRQTQFFFRLLTVSKTGELTLEDVDVSRGQLSKGAGILNNGILAMHNSTISGNLGDGVQNQGTLTIENSTISGNAGSGVRNGRFGYTYAASSVGSLKPNAFCSYHSGYYGFYGYYSPGVNCFYIYSGALTISNSAISKNGTGVFNQSGVVDVNTSTISGNKGSGVFNSGGSFDFYGKYFPAGDLSIANSTISKNSAQRGGGIFNQGILTIEGSVISGNKATDDGGGIFNSSNYNNAPAGDLSLLDTTITENRAKDSGGGLFNEGSLVNSNSNISGNKARTGADVFP